MKNSFAVINRIPSDVFSLIPEYLEENYVDRGLIAMSHVCHCWRELLIARPPLWIRLGCESTVKTRVYLERSKLSPLELSLCKYGNMAYVEDAIPLVVPHISRLKTLSIDGRPGLLQTLTPHLSCPIPLLRELTISFDSDHDPAPVLDTTLFDGDLSSLRSLSLAGVITQLPWKNLLKLTTFELTQAPEDGVSVTQLLDFFENAHNLRDITLRYAIPTSSNAPTGRVVSLPRLKTLTICADPIHSVLLNHLFIPVGVSLIMEFVFTGDKLPLPELLPETLENLKNIFPISSVNLLLSDLDKLVRLDGPNGELYMLGEWINLVEVPEFAVDREILRSLTRFDLSGTQRLAVTEYQPLMEDTVDKSAPYHILSCTENLRTLTLTQCNYQPFILPLNPDQNSSKRVLCPKLEELVLYILGPNSLQFEDLKNMAKERASAGKKLTSITILGPDGFMLGEEIFELKKYVPRVDYRVKLEPPAWNLISGDGGK